MPLPPDIAWHAPTWGSASRSLRVGGQWGLEVAYVNQRLDGRWLCTIRRHLDWQQRANAIAPDRATAMRWAEWWARPRADRLRVAAAEHAARRRP